MELFDHFFNLIYARYPRKRASRCNSDNKKYNLECWNEIEKNYSSKSRHYHNLEHLENMFNELNNIESKINDLDTLLFSVYYHDIIYKSTKKDNELQSALIFEKKYLKLPLLN